MARRREATAQVTLVSRNDRLLAGLASATSGKLTNVLHRRGVEFVTLQHVDTIERDAIVMVDGRRLRADAVVVATGLKPPALLEGFGLPLDPHGGLRVGSTLRSVVDSRIFATGDCASFEGHRLPKLGVFGVRQAPILLYNLVQFSRRCRAEALLEPAHFVKPVPSTVRADTRREAGGTPKRQTCSAAAAERG